MGVRRTVIVPKTYKDASYLTFGGGGAGGSTGSIAYGGSGGSGNRSFSTSDVQKLLKKVKEKNKQEMKEQLREYKRQLEMKEEIRKQEVKMEEEKKQSQIQQQVTPKILDIHTRRLPDNRERIFLCDMIETNPKEDNFIIKIIKNIGKKKPPKNMTIVQ